MKWWYTPQNGELYKWNEWEDVVFAIATMCRHKMENHVVPNYYIYCDIGLVDIIKGSELDVLSILRNGDDKLDNYKHIYSDYSERYEDVDEDFERLLAIVRRTYIKPDAQILFEKKEIDRINDTVERDFEMERILDKTIIKEYKMKYIHGNNAAAYVSNMTQISNYKLVSELDGDVRNIPVILDELYDLRKVTEEYCFVFAYNSNNLIGFTCIAHGTIDKCPMDARVIFRFLLLVGATDYIIIHNHPLGKCEMSQLDYEVTKSLLKASEFINITMLEHLIIGKDGYEEVLTDVFDMESLDITDVRKYYEKRK